MEVHSFVERGKIVLLIIVSSRWTNSQMAGQRQEHLTSLLLEGSGEAKFDVLNIHVVICAFQYGLFIWTGGTSLHVHFES